MIRYVLAKQFRHFRIALLPKNSATTVGPLPRTFRRTIRVWWAYCWRAVVYSLIVSVVIMLPMGVLWGLLSEAGGAVEALGHLLVQTLIAGAVGMYIFYSNILGEEFGDFRVCLIPREASSIAPGVTRTEDHVAALQDTGA